MSGTIHKTAQPHAGSTAYINAHIVDPVDGNEYRGAVLISDGKIADYREVANVGPAFVELGFAPERTAKILAKEGAHLKKQPEWKRHLA